MLGRLRAGELNDRAREALARGDRDEAVLLYQKAIVLAPEWSVAWFNLGLLYKKERAWDWPAGAYRGLLQRGSGLEVR